MSYAKWETRENMLKNAIKINKDSEVLKSGIPIAFDEENLYLSKDTAHTLVVGSIGSGKTQVAILPLIKLSMLAGESVIVNDINGDIYEKTAKNFKDNGYNVIVLNFENPKFGDSWNPLKLPYELYKNNEKDKALRLLEDLGYYLYTENNEKADPFWENMTIDYFCGIALYLFENAEEDQINFRNLFNVGNEVSKEKNINDFLEKIKNNNQIYCYVAGTLETACETRMGIIATFAQKSKKLISRENLTNMMLNSSFDIKDISNNKNIVYIISGLSSYSNSLIPLFINQVFDATYIFGNKEKTLNVILDEFDTLLPIKNFSEIINYSRGINIRYTAVIKTFTDLINTYGKEDAEIIKRCFAKLIYLLSNDIDTLKEISKLCGNQEQNGKVYPLITVEELKYLNTFEALILMPRIMPFKTKLIPDYQINWPFKDEKTELPLRKENNFNIFEI